MKLRMYFLLAICAVQIACDGAEAPSHKAAATQVEDSWEANVAFVEGRQGSALQVREQGNSEYTNWQGGKPIPPGATVKTGPSARARLAVAGGAIVLNHDTVMELVPGKGQTVKLLSGHAVFDMHPDRNSKTTIILPTGDVVLHGTKVSAVAGEKESVVSVSQGQIRVKYGEVVLEAAPGQEIVLPAEGPPRLGGAPDLSREMGWSQLVNPNDKERVEVDRGLGKLVGKTPGGEREWSLDMVRHGVDVRIQGNMAYTEIHESFKNPTGQTLEGVYRFPLPPDAQISRLALKVGNRWMEGEFVETKRAEWIWKDIINQWRDPAMLKWKHGNTFELRIFPIDPRAVREIKIGYVQELKPSPESGYAYTYPMPVDYAGLIKAETFDFEATIFGHDPTMPLSVSGYAATIDHAATRDDKPKTRVKYEAKDFFAAGDLAIEFRRGTANKPRSYGFKPTNRREKSYGLVTIRPEFEVERSTLARDFVLIADTSYARRGGVTRLQSRLIPRLVNEMDPLDRVTSIACATRCQPLGRPGFANPGAELATQVASALEAIDAQGSSNGIEALKVVERLAQARKGADRSRPLHVIYITDGLFSAGELRPGSLATAARSILIPMDARMSVVDLGGDNDASLQDALAVAGRGAVISLDPAQSRTGQALSVLSHHYGGTLTDVTIEVPPGFTDVFPKQLSALASGEEITLVGRFTGDVIGDVVVRAKTGGAAFEARYPMNLRGESNPANSFVPRSWAVRRIRDLELDGESNKRDIVSLSQQYGVLTRFTTLLALEDQDMMNEYGVRKRNRDNWDGADMPTDSDDREASVTTADVSGTLGQGPGKVGLDRLANKGGFASGTDGEVASEPMNAPEPKKKNRTRERAKDAKKPSTRTGGGTSASSKGSDGIESLLAAADPFGTGRGDVSKKEAKRPRESRRRPPRRRHWAQRAEVRSARPATSAEQRRVTQRSAQLDRDSDNRSKRMRLIRTQIRAGELAAAERQIDSWINTNPMDGEALVQWAQLLSHRGKTARALELLASAVDAAPRGKWIQTRIQAAYESVGEAELACAHTVSLVAVTGKGDAKASDCGIASDLSAFELGAGTQSSVVEHQDRKRARGDLRVDVEWTGGGDLDILLVEPNGRTLSWLSQRRKLKVYDVKKAGRESIVVPSATDGTYGIRLVRTDGGSSPLKATVTIKARGTSKTFDVVHAQPAVDVAEVEFSSGWR